MAKMTKTELIERIATNLDCSKSFVQSFMTSLEEEVSESLADGYDVSLGFCTFKVKTQAARTGRNPKTGESLEIPEKQVVRIYPSAGLKDVV